MSDAENPTNVSEESSVSVDGSFQIDQQDDGVFLTVKPAQGDGMPVREPLVMEELKQRDIQDYDFSAIIRVVKDASGAPVKIAEKSAPAAEPEIQVLVDRDRMSASLQIIKPKGSRPLAFDEVLEKIHSAGVVQGIDMDAVKRAYDRPGTPVTCAHGDAPVNGTDATIKHAFDMNNKGRPVELEDGRVDFKDLNLFTVVAEGDLLAEKLPPTQGNPGVDVLGQPIFPKPGKDIPLPLGKNVYADENKIRASIAGQLQLQNNKIHVSPVIEIKGDVDLSTGNVEFVGNVVVRGSVQTGFTVKADGNVEIYGSVSGGTVEGANIVIRMGIQGMQRGYVKAKENVTTKFIENATVSAEGDVMVNDVILHSSVSAGKRVIVEGRRGFIAGGHVIAAEEIRAKTVGTHLAVATDLEVGVNPAIRSEYTELRKEIKKNEITLDQAQKALNVLKGVNPADLPPDKREMMLKLTKAQFHLAGQVEAMRRRITEIELLFEEMRYGRIRVAEMVYPGVKIVIGTLVKPIRETLKFASFYAEEGEIKIGAFR
jgi:uncharacterized protein (DUF342 family)